MSKHYFTKFQDNWFKKPEYKNWLVKQNNFIAKCKLCGVTFVIKHDGEISLKKHESSKNHRKLVSAQNQSMSVVNFMTTKSTNFKNVIAEHQHSYISTDCVIKLNSTIYDDSSLSKLIHCGRTKASSFTENVLGPKSIEIVINDLKKGHNCRYFSISTDASNRGNEKLFPLIVTYFVPEVGTKNKILDFCADDLKSAVSIYNKIMDCLNIFNLPVENVTAFSADNANVNYGKHNSVYQKLKEKNTFLIKGNCNCHVIHNAAKYGCRQLSLDLETLVNKIYSEFWSSTTLKEKSKNATNFVQWLLPKWSKCTNQMAYFI